MKKRILIDANFPTETRVAVLDKNSNLEAFEYDNEIKRQIKNNIYLAKITRVEPSLQAAFVDFGDEKSGFLPFSEIHPDYFNIPVHDQKSQFKSLSTINPPEITSDDRKERPRELKSSDILDNDEIDIDEIQKMVEDKIQPDFDLDADESEIDKLSRDDEVVEEDYRIQEVIKKGQILLVQATKEERGNKGGITNLDIKRDFEYLSKLWNKIREATLKSTAPSFIHQEDSVMLKAVRDLFDKNVKEVLVQGAEAYENCVKFVRDMMPGEQGTVKEYKSKTPIFTKYKVEEQLTKLYQTNVHLPSGGYIVINPTEALISIDVNSGKSTQERNIEEMALKTNLEAAREIARQARLRDLSGLLVLDFIDMGSSKNRKIVERTLREFMSKDKARIQTSPISTFGLLELSRQRLRPSFLEVNSTMCNHCSGKGIIRADEANSMLILRTIENEIFSSSYDIVNVYGVASSIIFLLNNKRAEIDFIEQKYDIKLNFYIDKDATSDSYSIERIRLADKKKKHRHPKSPILQDTSDIYGETEIPHSKSRKKIDTKGNKRDNKNVQDDAENIKDKHSHNKDNIKEGTDLSNKNEAQVANIQEKSKKNRKVSGKKHTEKFAQDKSLSRDNVDSNDVVEKSTDQENTTSKNKDIGKREKTKKHGNKHAKIIAANDGNEQAEARSDKKEKIDHAYDSDKNIEQAQKVDTVSSDPENANRARKPAGSSRKRIAKKVAAKNAKKKAELEGSSASES